MTATLFLVFVAAVAIAAMAVAVAILPRRNAVVVGIVLPIWIIYVGELGKSGFLSNPALRPPGIIYIALPVFLFIMFGLARSRWGKVLAIALPLPLILGAQVYRVGVELFFHQLWIEGVVPRMLTFEGANLDIFIGLSAPLMAWIVTRGTRGLWIALGWNALGLLALANVAVRSALTVPGPTHLLHTETSNLLIATFPYMLIPGFLAPLAVSLHVLAIRALTQRLKSHADSSKTELSSSSSTVEFRS